MPNEKKYIEANAIVEFIDNNSIPVNDGYEKTYTLADIQTYIDAIPAADVAEVRHGHWNEHDSECECSMCGALMYCEFNYCPNCGARMDGDSNG